MKHELPRAYSYLRFSGKKQEKGDSIRRQTAMRDSWLARKGLTLDESLVLPDHAVSAFRGKNLSDGALGAFIKEVHAGRVPAGSYLIIEKIDRFTRFEPDEALPVFTKLLKLGVIIVTLTPEKEWNTEAIKGFGLMQLIVELLIAHGESKGKSERLAAVWAEKKRKAAEKLVTPRLPSWLQLVDGKPVFHPEQRKIMLQIVELAEKGHGGTRIASMFNKRKVPAMGWGNGWHGATINKILRSRALLGEYQPCKITPEGPKRRVPVGEPIKGYYPALLNEARFIRLQIALDGRTLARGDVGRHVSNLFSGLVVNARSGGGLFLKRIGRSQFFIPQEHRRGMGDKFSFSYRAFEEYFLVMFREISLADLAPPVEKVDETETNRLRLTELDRKIAKAKAKLDQASADEEDSLMDMLQKWQREQKELQKAIVGAQSMSAQTQLQNLGEAQSILDLLDKTSGDALLDLRSRLKVLIRSVVKEIYLLVDDWGEGNVAFVQVNFKSGGFRDIVILDAGKGVAKVNGKPVGFVVANRQQLPVLVPIFDLARWQTDLNVRKTYQDRVAAYQEVTPQATATKRMLAGELPYKVARDMGISNSTCYRWKKIALAKKPAKRNSKAG